MRPLLQPCPSFGPGPWPRPRPLPSHQYVHAAPTCCSRAYSLSAILCMHMSCTACGTYGTGRTVRYVRQQAAVSSCSHKASGCTRCVRPRRAVAGAGSYSPVYQAASAGGGAWCWWRWCSRMAQSLGVVQVHTGLGLHVQRRCGSASPCSRWESGTTLQLLPLLRPAQALPMTVAWLFAEPQRLIYLAACRTVLPRVLPYRVQLLQAAGHRPLAVHGVNAVAQLVPCHLLEVGWQLRFNW